MTSVPALKRSAHSAAPARRVARRGAAFAIALSVALAGCSSKNDAKLLNPDPPDRMYAIADALLTASTHVNGMKNYFNCPVQYDSF